MLQQDRTVEIFGMEDTFGTLERSVRRKSRTQHIEETFNRLATPKQSTPPPTRCKKQDNIQVRKEFRPFTAPVFQSSWKSTSNQTKRTKSAFYDSFVRRNNSHQERKVTSTELLRISGLARIRRLHLLIDAGLLEENSLQELTVVIEQDHDLRTESSDEQNIVFEDPENAESGMINNVCFYC